MSKLQRVINIYLSPTEVISELRESSDWFFPLVLLISVSLISSLLLLPSVIIPVQVEGIKANPNFTLEQKNMMLQSLQGPYPYVTTVISTFLGQVIILLILAGVLNVIGFIFGGQKVAFKSLFSAVCYVGLIGIIETIFLSIVMYLQKTINTGLNLGLFIKAEGYLGKLLRSLDFFGIWQTALLALVLIVFFKYSKVKAFLIMFGLYFALIASLALINIPGLG
jgi:hypothetical protein